jgi:uncharacterized protein with PIN domain
MADRSVDPSTPLLLDAMPGKLATYLRMCGYDTAYALGRGVEADDAVLKLAREEDRLLVTRDRQLASRADGVLLTERDVTDQLAELSEAGFDLALDDEPAQCGVCNGPVDRIEPSVSTPEHAPDPASESVWRCRDCGQHFWKGSHWDDVAGTLSRIA